jgi:GTP-dependent dephospho-CoA kinase
LSGEFRLPEELRPTLGRPLGKLFKASEVGGPDFLRLAEEATLVISVGDRVTQTFGELGLVPDVQVVDGRENRKGREPPTVPYDRLVSVSNPPGTLTSQAIGGVRSAMEGEKPARVLVDGEEDLVAIPVIAFAPDASVVFYGQPGEGIVAVTVDSGTKARNKAILAAMGASAV